MKYSSIILMGLGLVVGCIIGYAVHGGHKSEPSQPARPDSPPQHALAQNNTTHEQERLNEITKQLDQIRAELKKAQAYIQKLEPKAARYKKTRELWEKCGFGTTPVIFKDEGLIPSDTLIDFFGWDNETVAAINRIGEDTERKILEWESQQAVCVENTADRRVFEIPSAPSDISDGYKKSLESIIGAEDAELVMPEVHRKLDQYLHRRIISFSPVTGGDTTGQSAPPAQQVIRFELKGYNDAPDYSGSMDGDAGVSFSRSGTLPYAPGTYFYDRWHHLLGQNPF